MCAPLVKVCICIHALAMEILHTPIQPVANDKWVMKGGGGPQKVKVCLSLKCHALVNHGLKSGTEPPPHHPPAPNLTHLPAIVWRAQGYCKLNHGKPQGNQRKAQRDQRETMENMGTHGGGTKEKPWEAHLFRCGGWCMAPSTPSGSASLTGTDGPPGASTPLPCRRGACTRRTRHVRSMVCNEHYRQVLEGV